MSTNTDKGFTTINPATEKEIQQYTYMTADQAIKAVETCHNAFLDWKLKPLEDRAKVIKAIGQALINAKDDYAKLMTKKWEN